MRNPEFEAFASFEGSVRLLSEKITFTDSPGLSEQRDENSICQVLTTHWVISSKQLVFNPTVSFLKGGVAVSILQMRKQTQKG